MALLTLLLRIPLRPLQRWVYAQNCARPTLLPWYRTPRPGSFKAWWESPRMDRVHAWLVTQFFMHAVCKFVAAVVVAIVVLLIW